MPNLVSAPSLTISEFSSLSEIYLNVDDDITIDFDKIDTDDGMTDADKEVVKDINAMTTWDCDIGEIESWKQEEMHLQCELEETRDGLTDRVNMLDSKLKIKDETNDRLNHRIKELEDYNGLLIKQIEFLKNTKTVLAINSAKCIDDMRNLLCEYQKQLKLTCD